MKSWRELKIEASELAGLGASLLFRSGGAVGQAFLATLREDGAPRLHPVSLVRFEDRLYVLIPPASPKCADLIRDGRLPCRPFPRLTTKPARNSTWLVSHAGSRTQRRASL
jgi:hypothetical protein